MTKLFRRLLDIVFSLLVIIFLTIPVGIVFSIYALIVRKPFWECKSFYVHNSKIANIYIFNTRNKLFRNLPMFFNVLAGQIAIVGISFTEENEQIPEEFLYLLDERPGIFNQWYIRQNAKLDHCGKFDTDRMFLQGRTIKRDIGILIKHIPAILYETTSGEYKDKVNLLDVKFDNCTMDYALKSIKEYVILGKKGMFFFVNPDCLNKTFTDKYYYDIITKADYVFPDGIGINIGCNIIGEPLRQNVNGTDMFPLLCELCQDNGYSVYFIGAKPGVVDKMVDKVRHRFSGLRIAGYRDGYFNRETENDKVVDEINQSGADVLLVAFGVPIQEKWIYENKGNLKPSILMGVVGLFDFYSDSIKRAPIWLRDIGGEWIYRLLQEPKRMWRRYILGNPIFIHRVCVWKKKINDKG